MTAPDRLPLAGELHVSLRSDHAGSYVVDLAGELGRLGRAVLRPTLLYKLRSIDTANIELDLSRLAFVDADGARAIIETRRALESLGHSVRCVRVRPVLQQLFELLGLQGALSD